MLWVPDKDEFWELWMEAIGFMHEQKENVIRRPEKEAILPTEFSPSDLHGWFFLHWFSSENSTDSDKDRGREIFARQNF
jgi:hypothetical protein